jgi:hypothetical protein
VSISAESTDFTRIVLPDGNGRTLTRQLGFQVGETIHKGDVHEWPELSGYRVYRREFSTGGRCNQRGEWQSGTCLFLLVS